jgi:uncharacterized membrane protein YfbV (UPF0208 family)
MNKNNYKSSFAGRFLPYLVFIIVFSLVLVFVITGLNQASESSASEGLRIAENSIHRAVINCYASEGIYPPSFEYLKEHYGISVDENKYVVHYTIFASNIMPDITVLQIN